MVRASYLEEIAPSAVWPWHNLRCLPYHLSPTDVMYVDGHWLIVPMPGVSACNVLGTSGVLAFGNCRKNGIDEDEVRWRGAS